MRMRSILALTLCLSVAPTSAQSRPFTAEDMLAIKSFAGRVQVSANGRYLAYVLPDLADEWNVMARLPVGYVQVLALDGHRATSQAMSAGPRRSSFPRWSPDGDKLAYFIEDATGGQLHIYDSDSKGPAVPLGRVFHGKAEIAAQWAGDSILYALPFVTDPPAPPARIQVMHSSDATLPGDAFFQRHRRVGLRLVNTRDGSERVLIDGPVNLSSFQVSPTGGMATVQIGRQTRLYDLTGESKPRDLPGRGHQWTRDGARLLFLKRGRPMVLSANFDALGKPEAQPLFDDFALELRGLSLSPQGESIAALVVDASHQPDPEIEAAQDGMYSIARPFMDLYLLSSEDGEATNITADLQDQISDPVWSLDGKELYFRSTNTENYSESIHCYNVASKSLHSLTEQASYRNLLAVAAGLAFTRQSATEPRDLWHWHAGIDDPVRLTQLNPQLDEFTFSTPELIDYHNADGEPMAALLYRPPGMPEGTNTPVLTYLYEKLTPGRYRFNPQQQIFLTHGYAVLMPNVKVKVGATGTSFVKAVVPAVNRIREMGFSDAKFGLWGGSFGAYATSYVITQTDIFACAVSRATPPELFRNWASGRDRDSDNIESGQARMGGSPFEVQERYLAQSAFFHLDKVNTPVLLMHGVNDMTILYQEGAMMFYALRRLGKEATFVLYEHGDHSLSRHSRTDTLDVNRRMLDWFAKYLRQD